MLRYGLLCFVGVLMLAPTVYAKKAAVKEVEKKEARFGQCVKSKAITVSNYPGRSKIPHFNTLALPPGKAVTAPGQLLHLYGRLLDARCVPLKDATIELWQADANGKYMVANKEDLANPNAIFAGAGRTYSNELGEFYFFTVVPGASGKAPPQVFVRITHPKLKPFSTALALSSLALSPANPADRSAGLKGHIDLVIPGSDPFRTF